MPRRCKTCYWCADQFDLPATKDRGPISGGFCHYEVPTVFPDMSSTCIPVQLEGFCHHHQRKVPWWEKAIYLGVTLGLACPLALYWGLRIALDMR